MITHEVGDVWRDYLNGVVGLLEDRPVVLRHPKIYYTYSALTKTRGIVFLP